jgi:two-component system OmpR family response regulator
MPTVLVVDDNSDLRSIVVGFLRYHDYAVLEARSGEDAMKMLSATTIDVLIADLFLPGQLNGVALLFHYRKVYPKGCRILLTAALSDMVRSVCQYIDTVYLQKPFELDELLVKLKVECPKLT